jgi:hypothetical protein
MTIVQLDYFGKGLGFVLRNSLGIFKLGKSNGMRYKASRGSDSYFVGRHRIQSDLGRLGILSGYAEYRTKQADNILNILSFT